MESNRRKRDDISTNKEKGEINIDSETYKSNGHNKISKGVPDEELLTDVDYDVLEHDETANPMIARSSSEQSLIGANNNTYPNNPAFSTSYTTRTSVISGNPSLAPLSGKINTNYSNLDVISTKSITSTPSSDNLSRIGNTGGTSIGITNTATTIAGTGTAVIRPVRAAVPWDDMFQLLLAHHSTHGNCNVTKRGTATLGEREIKLGQWLSDQRKAYIKHKLAPDRLTRIQGLVDRGILNWDSNIKSDPLEERWDKSYDALVEYGKRHGNCNVPREYSIEESNGTASETATLRLGVWLHKQRTDFKNNKLEARKSLRLQELVDKQLMVWDQRGDQESARWDTYYNALLAYMSRYGHCNVPPKGVFYLEDDQVCKLGFWLKTQRIQLKKGKLKKDRLEKLQKLADAGFLALEEATTTQITVQQEPAAEEEEYFSDDYDQVEQEMFI